MKKRFTEISEHGGRAKVSVWEIQEKKVKESKLKIRVKRMSQMWKSIDRESYEKQYEGLNRKGKISVRELKIRKV